MARRLWEPPNQAFGRRDRRSRADGRQPCKRQHPANLPFTFRFSLERRQHRWTLGPIRLPRRNRSRDDLSGWGPRCHTRCSGVSTMALPLGSPSRLRGRSACRMGSVTYRCSKPAGRRCPQRLPPTMRLAGATLNPPKPALRHLQAGPGPTFPLWRLVVFRHLRRRFLVIRPADRPRTAQAVGLRPPTSSRSNGSPLSACPRLTASRSALRSPLPRPRNPNRQPQAPPRRRRHYRPWGLKAGKRAFLGVKQRRRLAKRNLPATHRPR